ncbi:hypothetical protein [Sulfolobus sp. E11-6]|uniref:hypothetical protein n=1 Tax=Sulfolobus sp. E11-6 TaxID=2663020 RepID=UPI001297B5D2|nr:hypothetical protein [Sulfolobus sp. E11-6]QGA68293.1 hypothetical protein GFS33_05570 [Sulfolobus sp. E11-6]
MEYSIILKTLVKDKRECKSFLNICKNEKFIFITICNDERKIYCGEVNGNSIRFNEKGNSNITYEIPISDDDNIRVLKISDDIYIYNIDESLFLD